MTTRTITLRQLCLQNDEDWQKESETPVEYEFRNGQKVFRGRYKRRGAYAPEE